MTTLQNLLKRGFSPTIKSINVLLLFLIKSQKNQLALHIFSQFSSTSFNFANPRTNYIIAHALLQSHRFEEAEIFMTHHERPDLLTRKGLWESLVRGVCVIERNPEKGLSILKDCVRNQGIVVSIRAFRTIILEFCSAGSVEGAVNVVELMGDGKGGWLFDGHACRMMTSVVVDGLCNHGSAEKAILFLSEMDKKGLKLDSVSYAVILRGLMKVNSEEEKLDGVLQLLDLTEKLEPEGQSFVYNNSVIFLCKVGFVQVALHVLLMMRNKDLIVESKAYYVLLKRLIFADMVQLVRLMLSLYLKEYGMFEGRMIKVLSLYLCKQNVMKTLGFLSHVEVKKIPLDVTTAVVDSLKKKNRVLEAHEFVVKAEKSEMEMDVVAYSIIIDGLCKEGHLEKALELCKIMRRRGIYPNIVTYNSIINGLRLQGCLVEAFRLFNCLEQNNISPTIFTYGTLIDALCREGYLEDAKKLFDGMLLKNLTPNTHIYNSLIYGYCSLGLVNESMEYLDDLELNHLQADAFTISSLLGGLYLKGDMEGALEFYTEYKSKGISPDILGFTCLIKGLCAKGRMEESRNILRDMLHCESVNWIINRAGDGIDVESLDSLLRDLCDEGSIRNAINLLSEIGQFSFPSARYSRVSKHENITIFPDTEMITSDEGLTSSGNSMTVESQGCHGKILDSVETADKSINLNNDWHSIRKGHVVLEDHDVMNLQSHDFEAYYSKISSLCSNGEFQKADRVVKAMMVRFTEHTR